MNEELDLPDLNIFKSNMEKSFQRTHSSASGSCIEASIENVRMKKRRRKKKFKVQERISMPKLKSSSLKSMLKESSPKSFLKILTPPESTQNTRTKSSPIVGKKVTDKYSSSLFSSPSYPTAESPIFNRTQKFDCSASATTLNESFLSETDERLLNSQTNLKSQLSDDWEDSTQNITPRSSRENSQPHISQKEHDCQSSLSECTLTQAFESPVHESSFELSESDSLESENHIAVNGLLNNLNEEIKAQNKSQNVLALQNHNISTQLQNFEWFVRDKMDKIEEVGGYMKQKLTNLEESNLAVVQALNGLKHVEREEPIRISDTAPIRYVECVMPKIPISRDVSLVILDSALENTQYMEQFVSEISRVVTLYVYNPRKSVKSIMTKLFTLNLLIKYSWSENTFEENKPTFSSLTNVLRAIARLLANYMSDRNMRKEIKEFFKRIPRIYEQQKLRYF